MSSSGHVYLLVQHDCRDSCGTGAPTQAVYDTSMTLFAKFCMTIFSRHLFLYDFNFCMPLFLHATYFCMTLILHDIYFRTALIYARL